MGTRLFVENANDLERKCYMFNKLYGYISVEECRELESAKYLMRIMSNIVDDDFFKLNYETLALYPEYINETIKLTSNEFSIFMDLYEKDIRKHYKENDFTLKKYFADEMHALLSNPGDKYISWG